MQQEIRSIVEESISWEILLGDFIGNSTSTNKVSSMKKVNRRYPYIHPGCKMEKMSNVVICVDHSFSITDEILKKFFGEMENLGDITDFTVVPFDSRIIENEIFIWEKGANIIPKRVARGGTNFDIPTQWINEHFLEFDAAIFMTDGQCFMPRDCIIPRAWIISEDGELAFDTEDIVIKMG